MWAIKERKLETGKRRKRTYGRGFCTSVSSRIRREIGVLVFDACFALLALSDSQAYFREKMDE